MSTRALLALLFAAVLCFSTYAVVSAEQNEDSEVFEDATAKKTNVRPILLASKSVSQEEVLAGSQIEVVIMIYNIGSVPAERVHVDDSNWGEGIAFEGEGGSSTKPSSLHVGTIQPLERKRISYYITAPTAEGLVHAGEAKVVYYAAVEGDEDAQQEQQQDGAKDKDEEAFITYSSRLLEDAELPYGVPASASSSSSTSSRSGAIARHKKAGTLLVLSQDQYDRRQSAAVTGMQALFRMKELFVFGLLVFVPIGLPYYFYYVRSKELTYATTIPTTASK